MISARRVALRAGRARVVHNPRGMWFGYRSQADNEAGLGEVGRVPTPDELWAEAHSWFRCGRKLYAGAEGLARGGWQPVLDDAARFARRAGCVVVREVGGRRLRRHGWVRWWAAAVMQSYWTYAGRANAGEDLARTRLLGALADGRLDEAGRSALLSLYQRTGDRCAVWEVSAVALGAGGCGAGGLVGFVRGLLGRWEGLDAERSHSYDLRNAAHTDWGRFARGWEPVVPAVGAALAAHGLEVARRGAADAGRGDVWWAPVEVAAGYRRVRGLAGSYLGRFRETEPWFGAALRAALAGAAVEAQLAAAAALGGPAAAGAVLAGYVWAAPACEVAG